MLWVATFFLACFALFGEIAERTLKDEDDR